MKRVGIIIGVPDSPHGRLPGVEVDLERYRRFLGSLGGGAWEPSEIQVLRNPNRTHALQAVQAAQNFDYGFVVFSGHGYHGVGASLSETVVCLTGHDEARISELFPRVRRSVVIADCCRKEVTLAANVREQLLASAAFANERRTIDRATARANFDAAVMQCEEGRIVLYACDVNQSAGDNTRTGGCFSSSLLSHAERWSENSRAGTSLDVRDAYNQARQVTNGINYPQNPQMEAGRRLSYYPLAVGERLASSSTLLYG
jgi:Caspase domain